MLDKYIEDLVKTSRVQEKLDEHLEILRVTAQLEDAREDFLKNASPETLAKIAGIKLPENVCGGCAAEMQKLGSVYQCSCGMMKRAKSHSAFSAAWEAGKKQYKTNSAAQAAAQKAEEKAEKSRKNPETASRKAYTAKVASVEKTASLSHFTKAMRLSDGDIDKALNLLEKDGYTKLGFSLGAVKPALQSAWGAVKPHAQAALGAVTGKAKQVGQTFQAARAAGAPGAKGVLGAIGQTAAAHPDVAVGAAGAAGLGAGYGLGKVGSAVEMLMKVGDAAGRILAKTAESPGVDIDPEEVAEAIDEAKGRENVPGRARNWGIGGGALGGLAGGAAGYLGSGLATRNPWLRAGAGALGALGAGAGGALLGSREGAEEAQADRLVSFLRGRRAYQTGAEEAYPQGLQRGYMAGMTGGMGEEEGPGPQ